MIHGLVLAPLALPFGLALAVSLLATLACERLAGRIGLVAHPREDRWHRVRVPLMGGVAMMIAVTVAGLSSGPTVNRFGWLGVLSIAMGAVGLLDDFRALRPHTKLAVQLVGAAVLIQLGTLLPLTPWAVVNVFLTLLWVVGITNAFNLLDNMDGLAAGVAALTALSRLALFLLDGDHAGAVMMAGLLGALLGFLARNAPPAKIFMGDAGSLFLGFFVAGTSLVSDYAYTRGIAGVMALPVLLTLVPILDTAFVTVTRVLSGRPVSQGGRDHTSHRLVALGLDERQALAVLLGISAASGVLAILSYRDGFRHSVILLALLVIALALLGVHLGRARVAGLSQGGPPTLRLVQDFPFKRQVASLAVDAVLIVTAYYAAYLLRFERGFDAEQANFLRSWAPVLALQVLALTVSGCYRGLWRYTSVPDLLRLVRGVTLGVGASVLYLVFTNRFEGFSRAVFVLDWSLLVLLLAGSRVGFRVLGERLRPRSAAGRRALIYGAGDGGILTLRELRSNAGLGREAVGFLDDDRGKRGTRILGLPVLGGLDAAENVCTAQRIVEVILASHKIPPERVQRLETMCSARGILVTRASLWIE